MASTSGTGYDRSTGGLVAFGITGFAAVMLLIAGMLQILQGVAAILEDEVFVTKPNYTYELDVTAWGWAHMILGVAGAAIALGILFGQSWGRVAGIGLAVISSVANFVFMPYYPIWALVIIGFNVLVIWALYSQLVHDDGH